MSKFLLSACIVVCTAASTLATFTRVQAAEPEQIEVTAKALRPLFPREAQGVVGTYRLSDGRSLSLRQQGGMVVAKMDREPNAKLLLAPDASGWQLRAADGHLQIAFERDLNGMAKTIVVTLDHTAGGNQSLVAVAGRPQQP